MNFSIHLMLRLSSLEIHLKLYQMIIWNLDASLLMTICFAERNRHVKFVSRIWIPWKVEDHEG